MPKKKKGGKTNEGKKAHEGNRRERGPCLLHDTKEGGTRQAEGRNERGREGTNEKERK